MSLLTLIDSASKRLGLGAVSVVVGNTDENIVRMLALANEEGKQLATRHRWQRLTQESTFTSVATESQGAITTLAGADFGWICQGTVWNRSQNREWIVVDDVDWQAMKASGITGPYTYIRIRGNNLVAQPVPTAGHTIAFEWVSKNWCESSGGTDQTAWAADTDVAFLDEDVMAQGLIWRWKQVQGFDYAEDFTKYEHLVELAISRDGAKKRISMGGRKAGPSIRPQEGSWTL